MPNKKSETFTPHTPEKKINVQITEREGVLLTKLRAFPYGKVLVHKAEGLIIRIEPTNSLLIQPNPDDINLG